MHKAACLVAALVTSSAFAAQEESGKFELTPQMERIQRALLEHAGLLLERYGTTFYALGMYLSTDGKLRQVVPRIAAPLEPELIGESLKMAVREHYRSEARVLGIAVDIPDAESVRIEFEDQSGRCRLLRHGYRFEKSGKVVFTEPRIEACDPSMLSGEKDDGSELVPSTASVNRSGAFKLDY